MRIIRPIATRNWIKLWKKSQNRFERRGQMKISRKTRRKYRLKAKRLVYQFKKIVRGKKTLPIRSEREFANLIGADSLRLARKVAMGMSLKLSHLPEDLGEDEWC